MQNTLVNMTRVLDGGLRLQDGLSLPATKLNETRTFQYLNVSVRREERSHLTGNMVIEGQEKQI